MRISSYLFPLSVLAAMCALPGLLAAQDTNFPTGPQYLLTNGSALFARPISTPSLSFATPMQEATEHDASSAAPVEAASQANATSVQPANTDLFPIYYGTPRGSEASIGFQESQNETVHLQPPAGFFETGVTRSIGPERALQMGYGLTLAEVAAQMKARKAVAPRTYTNADIDRLRQGS